MDEGRWYVLTVLAIRPLVATAVHSLRLLALLHLEVLADNAAAAAQRRRTLPVPALHAGNGAGGITMSNTGTVSVGGADLLGPPQWRLEREIALRERCNEAGSALFALGATCSRCHAAVEEAWTLTLTQYGRALLAAKPDALGTFLRMAARRAPTKETVAVARALPLPLRDAAWGSILFAVAGKEAVTALVMAPPHWPRPVIAAQELYAALNAAAIHGAAASLGWIADAIPDRDPKRALALDIALDSAVRCNRPAAAREVLLRLDASHWLFDAVLGATVRQRPDLLRLLASTQPAATRRELDGALWVAAAYDLVDAARALLELGANVHVSVKDPSDLFSQLRGKRPPAFDDDDAFDWLAGFGSGGMPTAPTPLHLAVRQASPAMLDLLLSHGAGRAPAPSQQDDFVAGLYALAVRSAQWHATAVLRRHLPDEMARADGAVLATVAGLPNAAMALSCTRRLLDDGVDVNADNARALRVIVGSDVASADVVRLLLDRGANVHANNDEAVCSAARCRSDAAVLRLLLDHGADVHARNDEPVRAAVARAAPSVDAIALLLDRGADPALDYGALLVPAVVDARLVRLLLARGANARSKAGALALAQLCARGGTPSAIAVAAAAGASGRACQAKLLLEHGADVNANGGQALVLAAAGSAEAADGVQLVMTLVKLGAPTCATLRAAAHATNGQPHGLAEFLARAADARTEPAGSTLVAAVVNGRANSVAILLQHGADVHFADGLAWASSRDVAISQLLLEHGADPTARGGSGLVHLVSAHPEADVLPLVRQCIAYAGSAIHLDSHLIFRTAVAACRPLIAACLLDCGADPNANHGEALKTAAQSTDGGAGMLELLLARGADARRYGASALLLALQRSQPQLAHRTPSVVAGVATGDDRSDDDHVLHVAMRLADAGAELTGRDNELLCAAVDAGLSHVVAFLLDRGANVHARKEFALREAVRRNLTCVGRLLAAGADVRASGVLDVAAQRGDAALLALLEHARDAQKGEGRQRRGPAAAGKARGPKAAVSKAGKPPGDARKDSLSD